MSLLYLGHFGNCSSSNQCGEDEGDCDSDIQCKIGHICGTDNCRNSDSFESSHDCCYNNDEDFCTIENLCGVNEGDCDSHDVCLEGLVCGLNNCPNSLGYDSKADCCYDLTVGDEHYCTTDNPCGENEGDCDSNNECQTNLICDTANNCSASLGFAHNVDCCLGGCKYHKFLN